MISFSMTRFYKNILVILAIGIFLSSSIAQDFLGLELGADKSTFCEIYNADCTEQRETAIMDVDGLNIFVVYQADALDKIIEISVIMPEVVINTRDARTKRKMNSNFKDWIEGTNTFLDQKPKTNFDVKRDSDEDHKLYTWENQTHTATIMLLVDASDSNLYFPAYTLMKKIDTERMRSELLTTIENETIFFEVECPGTTKALNDFAACYQFNENTSLEYPDIALSISNALADFDDENDFDFVFSKEWTQPYTNRTQYINSLKFGTETYDVFFAGDTRYLLITNE